MSRKKRGPLGYLFSASILPVGLILIYRDLGIENESNLKALVLFCLIFLLLSVLWDVMGMINLLAEGLRGRIAIGVSAILFQIGAYYWLWQALGIQIGEITW